MDAHLTLSEHDPLVINPYVTVTVCGTDEILVKHGGRSRFSRIIRDESRTGLLARLLRHFTSPHSAADLREAGELDGASTEDTVRVLGYLREAEVLIAPTEHLTNVYLRMQSGAEAPSRLSAASIGIIGAGPLGSRIAREIARFRPRAMTVLDDRRASDTDRSYFDLPAERVRSNAPYVTLTEEAIKDAGLQDVTTIDAAPSDGRRITDVFDASTLVVAALEWYSPSALHAINQIAVTVGKPWMSVLVDGSEALIGPLYVPGETICYNEFEIQNEAAVSLQDDYLLYKETQLDRATLQAAHLVLPPFLAVVAGWTATSAVGYVSSGRSFLASRAMRIDFERLSVDYQDVLKLPRCPACSSQRAAYRHTYL